MQMLDALTGRSSAVGDDPEAVLEAELVSELRDDLEDMSDYSGIIGAHLCAGADMLPRDDEKVPRRLRVNIIESVDEVIRINAARGDLPRSYLAEKAV
jgi:hypothetical protein